MQVAKVGTVTLTGVGQTGTHLDVVAQDLAVALGAALAQALAALAPGSQAQSDCKQ